MNSISEMNYRFFSFVANPLLSGAEISTTSELGKGQFECSVQEKINLIGFPIRCGWLAGMMGQILWDRRQWAVAL